MKEFYKMSFVGLRLRLGLSVGAGIMLNSYMNHCQ